MIDECKECKEPVDKAGLCAYHFLSVEHEELTVDVIHLQNKIHALEQSAETARNALNRISDMCINPDYTLPEQVVQDVEVVVAALRSSRKNSAAWKALAKEQASRLRRTKTRGEHLHITRLRRQRDAARAELRKIQGGGKN